MRFLSSGRRDLGVYGDRRSSLEEP